MVFWPSKTPQHKHIKIAPIFHPWKLHQKSSWKRRRFFVHRNYIKKVCKNDVEICWYYFWMYWCNIDIKTSNRYWLDVLCPLGIFVSNIQFSVQAASQFLFLCFSICHLDITDSSIPHSCATSCFPYIYRSTIILKLLEFDFLFAAPLISIYLSFF